MVYLRVLLLIIITSCSKTSYVLEQSWSHLRIFYFKPESNESVLKNKEIPQTVKNKIKQIEVYKKYFYDYFSKEQTDIYSQTVFLDSNVLTYLVIASPHDEIKAKTFSFPFVGAFPYLGFYKKKSAVKFKQKLEEQDYITYMRNVDAYSSLGHFDDPIFSTFFKYSEKELASIVFHELFHTIFFVKDNVQLNENMANYFSDKLVESYFKVNKNENLKKKQKRNKFIELKQFIVVKAKELNILYKKSNSKLSKKQSKGIIDNFLKNNFSPNAKKKCNELKISLQNCFILKYEWSNATFASFITYEKNRFEIDALHKGSGGSLLDFYYFLEKNYEIYKDNDFDEQLSFSKFLLQKVD